MEDNKENKIYTPIELFGIECGKGWHKLIEPIIEYINDYNKDKNEEEQIHILQIKEKFGQLRFYTNFSTKELHDMINKAEEKSYDVCETCGSEQYVGSTTQGWIRTICIDCIVKELLDENSYIKLQKWYNHEDKELYEISSDNAKKMLKNIKK